MPHKRVTKGITLGGPYLGKILSPPPTLTNGTTTNPSVIPWIIYYPYKSMLIIFSYTVDNIF